MSDLYENLLRATDNRKDITTEKYATITKIDGLFCSVKELDTDLEHSNVPILNGADLKLSDKVIIGFLNNSIYDVVCYGVLDRKIGGGGTGDYMTWNDYVTDLNTLDGTGEFVDALDNLIVAMTGRGDDF